ncbi:MAG: hypothetical protein ACPGSB_07130 [Opitutales bacterium]
MLLLFSGLILLALVGLVVRGVQLEDASVRVAAFPRSGPGFSSQQVELTEFEKDMLGEASGYKFIYLWKGLGYALTMIDGTDNRQAVHDPRYCFRGAGWEIVGDEEIDFFGGHARRIELRQADLQSEALFFYSDGTDVFGSPLEYWMRATVRRWLRQFGGEEPVLVMVQPVEPGVPLDAALGGLLPLLPVP